MKETMECVGLMRGRSFARMERIRGHAIAMRETSLDTTMPQRVNDK